MLNTLAQDPDTGEYVDVPEEKDALIRALYTGIDNTNPTIADAFAYYLEAKAKKNDVERRKQLMSCLRRSTSFFLAFASR